MVYHYIFNLHFQIFILKRSQNILGVTYMWCWRKSVISKAWSSEMNLGRNGGTHSAVSVLSTDVVPGLVWLLRDPQDKHEYWCQD